jgi:hypothetical protein
MTVFAIFWDRKKGGITTTIKSDDNSIIQQANYEGFSDSIGSDIFDITVSVNSLGQKKLNSILLTEEYQVTVRQKSQQDIVGQVVIGANYEQAIDPLDPNRTTFSFLNSFTLSSSGIFNIFNNKPAVINFNSDGTRRLTLFN